MKDTVIFYECLQQVSAAYLIPLMPFDSICLSNNYEGLFPPGLGTEAYAECCVVVLELLPCLLPTSDLEIQATVSAVRNSLRKGYDLLWRVMELYILGFDPTIPIAPPIWTRDTSILESAKVTCSISNSKQKRTRIILLGTGQTYSFARSHPRSVLMLSPHYKLQRTLIGTQTTIVISLITCMLTA